ncbi:hypothetical protein QBC43DRAFT_253777 [Cladorrhinum sp. PSN259]|nr:hypothetical protein QBC43DRAFT_253777 [Cladorrhinum sp. PSN259]
MASDKTIVFITGANGGIGLETVVALSQASADFHILLGARSIEKGEKALSEIQSNPHPAGPLKSTISVVKIDLNDEKSIRAAAEHIDSQYGKLDVLINNAGVIVTRPCDTLTNLREHFETNVYGPYLLTEVLEPVLKKSNKTPYIIHVSSEQGSIHLRLDPEYPFKDVRGDTYRMSKAAMNMMAACHRFNYAEFGWKVCAFNPGFCVTNLTGEKGREMRIAAGARPARDPADALVEIVQGKRDGDLAQNGIVDLDGGVNPW